MITELIKGKEMKLKNIYNYVGPNTPIDNYILNLKNLERFYDRFNFISLEDVEYKNLFTRPSYDIDYICCEHDIYYWIAEQKTKSNKPIYDDSYKKSLEKKQLELQHKADDILIKKCYKLLQNKHKDDPERFDILLVMQLINLKKNVENDLSNCCNLS